MVVYVLHLDPLTYIRAIEVEMKRDEAEGRSATILQDLPRGFHV